MNIDLGDVINSILEEYAIEVQEELENSAKATAQYGAKQLRATSPNHTGDYKKGWSYKKMGEGLGNTSYKVHNKTDYQLTHLLEYGHVSRNQYGQYGRVRAYPHIKQVEEQVKTLLEEEIRKRLS